MSQVPEKFESKFVASAKKEIGGIRFLYNFWKFYYGVINYCWNVLKEIPQNKNKSPRFWIMLSSWFFPPSWNLMEPHGTSQNLLEPSGTSWNLLKPPETS